MIEILPGVFYDPSLPWYKQSEDLIDLAEDVMTTTEPIDSETETGGGNSRYIWATWQTTTSEGTFDMRVDYHWLYDISSPAFMAKEKQDTLVVTQIL